MGDIIMDKEFTELAYSALQSKAPYIAPHIVGFQAMFSSDDSSRMIGMFGLNMGGKVYFVPVFFLKGSVKPLVLMFDYDANQFMPFERDWLEAILKTDKMALGGPSRDPIAGFSTYLSPNTDPSSALISQNNFGVKYASARTDLMQKVASKKCEKSGHWLPKGLAKSSPMCKKAFVTMLRNEEFARIVDQKIGLAFIKEALATSNPITTAERDNEPATADGGVEFISAGDRKARKAVLDKLPISSREELMRKGYYIDDKRPASAKATVYNTQYASQFANPSKPGEFSTILEDGRVERVLVLVRPFLFNDNQVGNECFVIEPGSLAHTRRPISEVYVSPVRRSEDTVSKVLSRTITSKAMLPTRQYLLVTPDLRCTEWFTVLTTRIDNAGTVHYRIRPSSSYEDISMVVGLSADWFKKVGNEVIAPKGCVALERDFSNELKLGVLGDLTNKLLHTGLEPCIMTHDGVEFGMQGEPQKMDQAAAMRALVVDKGLGTSDAENILKKTASESKVSFLIKKAQPVPQNMVAMSENPQALVPTRDAPEQVGIGIATPAYSYEDPYKNNPGFSSYLPEIPLLASKFSDNIFDSSVMLSLADTDDPTGEVLEFMPDLEAAVDKLGRTLFLFWWKYDDFRKSFSPAEMASTESDLRMLFVRLGTLMLRFKRKAQTAKAVD